MWSSRRRSPLFRPAEAAIDKALGEIDLATLLEVPSERLEHPLQGSVPTPLLKAAMAGLVWRVTVWQILPGCSNAKHPEDPVQYVARISPRPAPSIRPAARPPQEGFHDPPPLFRQIHDTPPLRGGSRFGEFARPHCIGPRHRATRLGICEIGSRPLEVDSRPGTASTTRTEGASMRATTIVGRWRRQGSPAA